MSDYLLEYMKIHLVSLMQDLEGLEDEMEKLDENSKDYKELDFEFNHISGQILITRHFIQIGEEHARNSTTSAEGN